MIRKRVDNNFMSIFNTETGKYIRTGIIRNGKDTGADPFMASFPELLDVGIMGHCQHGLSGLCRQSGVECYQSGDKDTQPNMPLEDFLEILRQCNKDTYQIALGGRGDPDMHENFEEILRACRQYDVVPNFTSSGYGFTKHKAELCKKYCGAVAISWYRSSYTNKAIQMLLDAGVKTNIHYVLGRNTLREAISLLEGGFPEGINAVVFLLHKPVGSGSIGNVLTVNDPDVQAFFKLIDARTFPFKIGFDSCSVPALIHLDIANESVDTCEGARWSAYITPDMKMLPCSFDNQAMRWAVDLRKHTLKEAWFSPEFEDFRRHFRNACPDCQQRELCMGGCPIVPQIVLCKDKVIS